MPCVIDWALKRGYALRRLAWLSAKLVISRINSYVLLIDLPSDRYGMCRFKGVVNSFRFPVSGDYDPELIHQRCMTYRS